MTSIMTDLIKTEHRRAELDRLDRGFDGCGCMDCQALYRTLDLSVYGKRVKNDEGWIIISGISRKPVKEEDFLDEPAEVKDTAKKQPATEAQKSAGQGTIPVGIMKQASKRGRRIKSAAEAVSRTTEWRRRKK